MAKIDLALINEPGNGRPVLKELDRPMVKYIVGQRKAAIEADRTLFDIERWDHSDVFYAIRTYLNKHGWDTSVYNDNVVGGSKRRKDLYDMIKEVCENTYGVKRHEIGIYPEDRAIMAFKGRTYSVGFDNLRNLMHNGTHVIVVEKQGTVIKMVPFTENLGLAFIQSQGFVSEYGTALAALCNRQGESALHYTKDDNGRYWVPKYIGHLGTLTDCDHSGVVIGLKIRHAVRLGIDLNTVQEMNDVNPGLDLEIDDLQESTEPNSHWIALRNLVDGKRCGKAYEGLSQEDRSYYIRYLSQYMVDGDGQEVRFIDYIHNSRIELNTILAVAKPEAFWNWLKYKISKTWSYCDYRRVISPTTMDIWTPTMIKFNEWLQNEKIKPVIKDHAQRAEDDLSCVKGFLDIYDKEDEIRRGILYNTLLKAKKIQNIDSVLKAIMKNERTLHND